MAQFQFALASPHRPTGVARQDREPAAAIVTAANGQSRQDFGGRFARTLAADAGPARKSIVRRFTKGGAAKRSRLCRPTPGPFRLDSNRVPRHPLRQVASGTSGAVLLTDIDFASD